MVFFGRILQCFSHKNMNPGRNTAKSGKNGKKWCFLGKKCGFTGRYSRKTGGNAANPPVNVLLLVRNGPFEGLF